MYRAPPYLGRVRRSAPAPEPPRPPWARQEPVDVPWEEVPPDEADPQPDDAASPVAAARDDDEPDAAFHDGEEHDAAWDEAEPDDEAWEDAPDDAADPEAAYEDAEFTEVLPEESDAAAFGDEEFEEEAAPPRRLRRWVLAKWLFILTVWGTVLGGAGLFWFSEGLPRPDSALEATRRPSLTLQDRSGRAFAVFGDVVGETVHLKDLPAWLPNAAVSVEDRRFWTHPGLDPVGIARALWVNLTAGRVVQGGSTLTQQVAKNLFLSNERTLRRKVQEVLLTLWLERHFSKTEILEIWLNRVYLGAGAWGVDAAAQLYFGVPAKRLNLWQSAVIAGLPRAPSRFSPRVDPQAAAARGRQVLQAMVAAGAIGAAQAEQAAAQIAFPPRPEAAGWFADWVGAQSEALVPENADAVIRTTLDARVQASAETRLASVLDGPGAAVNAGQGAVVVLDAASGAVRAMVGGRDRRSAFNRAVQARRQPGSAFKPFVWLAALETGLRPEDVVSDAPVRIGNWSPANFDGRYRGEVTLEDALAESLNTVAVRLQQQAGGPRAVAEVARRLGIRSALPENDTLALGTGEVGVLELAGAYAGLCNGGLRIGPTGVEEVRAEGRGIAPFRPQPERAVQADHAAMMVRMLGAVVARGSGRAAGVPGRVVVGKTGTTQEYRDAWFVGCTGPSVIAVWIGNDNNAPMQGVTGGSLPARVFHDIAADMR